MFSRCCTPNPDLQVEPRDPVVLSEPLGCAYVPQLECLQSFDHSFCLRLRQQALQGSQLDQLHAIETHKAYSVAKGSPTWSGAELCCPANILPITSMVDACCDRAPKEAGSVRDAVVSNSLLNCHGFTLSLTDLSLVLHSLQEAAGITALHPHLAVHFAGITFHWLNCPNTFFFLGTHCVMSVKTARLP